MNFKQRILKTMQHEEPDRVPVMGLILDPATTNRVLGKESFNLAAMLQSGELDDATLKALQSDETWNQTYLSTVSDSLESAARLGFDANWVIYSYMQLQPDPQTSLGWVWHDPYGRVWEIGSDNHGNTTTNYARGLCTTPQKWEAWVESKREVFDRMIDSVRAFHIDVVEKFGDRIYPIGYAAPGVFENCWQPMGFPEFTRLMYQDPEFVHRIVAFHTELYLRFINAVMDSGVEVVLGGDDVGQKTGPLVRPAMIEKFFGNSYREISQCVHDRGRTLIWHSCGNIYQFLDMYVDWGIDGIITMEPTAGMELKKVREQIGHKLVLIGNLDITRLLVSGSKEEVEQAVKKAIADAGPGGGYVLSACHSHSEVDPERLKWMIDAAHRFGQYPLSLPAN
ncbi:MAG: hypothetical protein HOC23_13200 [Halieaceae bacterium]|jgi:hypothetical protein|nr:hypothetical protein [Halieaceae bacterium]